jgi:chemotaxis signal transduction protein
MTSQSDATSAHDVAPLALAMALSSAQAATQEQTLLRALERAEAGQTLATDPAEGEEHLLCWLGTTPYLVRLADLREVLPGLPPHVALPFSPQWLWGVFPLRAELIALVDPLPTLLHGPEAARHMTHAASASLPTAPASAVGRPETPRALVVGEGDHLLALVADRIGDIYPLRPEDAGDADDQSHRAPAAAHALPAYVAGVYPITGLERPALALRIAQVCDDIFAALQERPAHE